MSDLDLIFVPIVRGYCNASMKDKFVRSGGLYYNDAELFDLIMDSRLRIIETKERAKNIYLLWESMVDLRDLQTFLDYTYSISYDLFDKYGIEKFTFFIASGIAHYMGKMHESDSHILQKQSPRILREKMNFNELQLAIEKLINCVKNMCAINTKVILSALKQ